MVFDLSILPRTQRFLFLEELARGSYISLACDYERVMDDLIVLCEIDKVCKNGINDKTDEEVTKGVIDYKLRVITQLEMGKKLERCKRGLKKYNHNYFVEFSPFFIIIADLVKDRNLMAHGYTDFDIPQQPNKTLILFENVEKGKKKEKVIDFTPFIKQLEKYRNGIMELMGLTVTMRGEIYINRHII